MKSISQVSPCWKHFDTFSMRHHHKFPKIDFYFQETAPEGAGSSGGEWRRFASPGGFHQVSGHYIARETNRHFVADAIVFGMIITVSAWPIISMIRALPQLFR